MTDEGGRESLRGAENRECLGDIFIFIFPRIGNEIIFLGWLLTQNFDRVWEYIRAAIAKEGLTVMCRKGGDIYSSVPK